MKAIGLHKCVCGRLTRGRNGAKCRQCWSKGRMRLKPVSLIHSMAPEKPRRVLRALREAVARED